MVIDYVINRIPFKLKHIGISMAIMVVYLVINAIYTLETGTPVYPPLTFKDWETIGLTVGVVAIETGIYLLMHYLTEWKLKKYMVLDLTNNSDLTVFSLDE